MRDVKPEKMGGMLKPMSEKKEYYPMIDIPLSALPEAKDWQVGETYEVKLKVKQVGLHVNGEHHQGSASFELRGIEPVEKKKVARYQK